jgi:uncharacterized protein (TIGR03437 family)
MTVLRLVGIVSATVLSAAAQTPVVASGGVVDAATFHAPVTPGSLVSIFGTGLAAAITSASVTPLPETLGLVTVSFNGIAAPLLYVSPTQINAQLPWRVPSTGAVSVTVTNNGSASAPQAVQVAPFSPGFFAIGGYAVAVNPDGSVAAPAGAVPGFPSHPATPGDTLTLYASGLGVVSPAALTGNDSIDTLRRTLDSPTVSIGGVAAPLLFAGLSPQFVGVYQINVAVPPAAAATAAPLQIQAGGVTGTAQNVAVGAGWTQWSQNPQHTSAIGVAGQNLSTILADILYDPLTAQEESNNYNELTAHYQVPLVDGNDVYMESKSGVYNPDSYASETWGENKFTWIHGQLVLQWSYSSDWTAPGSQNDFWEPVFHAVLANDVVYLPGASGSIIEIARANGAPIQRIAPFGTDPNTYETGPLTADPAGNVYYNVIQVAVDPVTGFYGNDVEASWLVKVTPAGSVTMAAYSTLTSPEAPSGTAQCIMSFPSNLLPWPPSTMAAPPTGACGSQRVGLNVAPAVGLDGTIYTISRAHFNDRYAFLVALNPDLSKKWAASLRNRFHDGCGVAVADGGWLPPNGSPGGCRSGSSQGVDPLSNQPGDGSVIDDSSATPVVAPDGTILFGTWSRYNYAQGHLVHFDTAGHYLGAFGFGWDTTPAIYAHDGTWSAVTKNNHYGGIGSYCDDDTQCPPDRNTNNAASPEQYFMTQLDANLNIDWSYLNTNTQSCTRNSDGSVSCVSDHSNGFEWCVNSPAVDTKGVIYANSEDGNLYAIAQGGRVIGHIFQQLALGAAYTPASVGGDGKLYSQNGGYLFVVGK